MQSIVDRAARVVLPALLLLVFVAGGMACGGDDEAEAPPTTVGQLFEESAATTTLGGLRVGGWTRRELPDLRAEADRCAASVDVDAPADPDEGPRTVVVESGDTLGKIAKRFDRTVDQFMRANGMSDPNLLKVGQVLVVPAQRAQDVSEPDGPSVVVEPVFCEIDTGVAAFGPEGQQIGGPGIVEVFGDWPRLDGPREAPRVNGRLRGLVSASIRSFLDDSVTAVERGGYACRDASHNRCAWLQHRPEVLLATDDLLSVRDVVRYLLPGASAVEVEVRTSTFDLATGRPITVDALFDQDTDWTSSLSAAAVERLADQPWTDERRVAGAGPDAKNFERFNLAHGGLVLSFAPGTIGGAGSEDVSVTVPYRILDGYWAGGGPVSWLGDAAP